MLHFGFCSKNGFWLVWVWVFMCVCESVCVCVWNVFVSCVEKKWWVCSTLKSSDVQGNSSFNFKQLNLMIWFSRFFQKVDSLKFIAIIRMIFIVCYCWMLNFVKSTEWTANNIKLVLYGKYREKECLTLNHLYLNVYGADLFGSIFVWEPQFKPIQIKCCT